jgi:hypothetical protein
VTVCGLVGPTFGKNDRQGVEADGDELTFLRLRSASAMRKVGRCSEASFPNYASLPDYLVILVELMATYFRLPRDYVRSRIKFSHTECSRSAIFIESGRIPPPTQARATHIRPETDPAAGCDE